MGTDFSKINADKAQQIINALKDGKINSNEVSDSIFVLAVIEVAVFPNLWASFANISNFIYLLHIISGLGVLPRFNSSKK